MLNIITAISIIVCIIIIVHDALMLLEKKKCLTMWVCQIFCFIGVISYYIIYPNTDLYGYDPDKIVSREVVTPYYYGGTQYRHMEAPEKLQIEGIIVLWIIIIICHLLNKSIYHDNDD